MQLEKVNDRESLKIIIPLPSNYQPKIMHFSKSVHITVTLVKMLLTQICNFGRP